MKICGKETCKKEEIDLEKAPVISMQIDAYVKHIKH